MINKPVKAIHNLPLKIVAPQYIIPVAGMTPVITTVITHFVNVLSIDFYSVIRGRLRSAETKKYNVSNEFYGSRLRPSPGAVQEMTKYPETAELSPSAIFIDLRKPITKMPRPEDRGIFNEFAKRCDITSYRPCRHLGDRGHHRLEPLRARQQ